MTNYPLRLPVHLMEDARRMAREEGVSINQFFATLIAERVGEMKAMRQLKQRIASANPERALALLRRVPERAPLPGDEMPE